MGTPGYMSPEQIEGKQVDGRSDIYALGALTFEMLTGQRPFDADTPAMMMVKQMTEPPPRLADVRPDLPLEYDTLLERTMARDPEKRPQTAGEVAKLLFAATRASRRQSEPKTAVALPPTPPSTAEAITRVEPPSITKVAAKPTRPSDTKSVEVIPCPHCDQPVNISGHGESIHCEACGQDSILAGHTCPNCYHYHEAQTAVCLQCGEGINRACGHCYTPNWGGDEQCRECGRSLDIFELMSSYSSSATAKRLQRQMSDAQTFKKAEKEASKKRMAELEAIEAKRQAILRQRLQKKQKQEQAMLFVALAVIAVFLIVILVMVIS